MPTLALRPARRPRLAHALCAAVCTAAVAPSAAACGGGDATAGPTTEPDAQGGGRYTLVAVDGRPLPAVVTGRPGEYRAELLGGTLELGADRTFALEQRLRETNLQSGQVATATSWVRSQYGVRGRVVRFEDVYDPWLVGADATVSGATLTYGPLTFRR